jgi:hypothetical protein
MTTRASIWEGLDGMEDLYELEVAQGGNVGYSTSLFTLCTLGTLLTSLTLICTAFFVGLSQNRLGSGFIQHIQDLPRCIRQAKRINVFILLSNSGMRLSHNDNKSQRSVKYYRIARKVIII